MTKGVSKWELKSNGFICVLACLLMLSRLYKEAELGPKVRSDFVCVFSSPSSAEINTSRKEEEGEKRVGVKAAIRLTLNVSVLLLTVFYSFFVLDFQS